MSRIGARFEQALAKLFYQSGAAQQRTAFLASLA